MKKKAYGKIVYFLPPLIVAAVLFLAFIVDGIFPFGSGSVVYDDLGQTTVPTLTTVWDVLHGNANALFCFNTGGGVFIISVLTQLMNPLNIIYLLLCPRAGVLTGMSFLLLAKLMLMSVTAFAFFNKTFKLSAFWKISLSVMYAFCAYALMYYTNIGWLDNAAVFPLIISALLYMFETRKPLPYVLLLTYSLVLDLYISYMVFLFLFLIAGLYIFLLIEKEDRKKACVNLGVGSFISLLLSAVVSIPSYVYMTGSARYGETFSLTEILNTVALPGTTKLSMLLIMTALPLVLFVVMLYNFKKARKQTLFFFISSAVCALPAVFENINLFWHMGSYIYFPMRYAFMLEFILLAGAAFSAERFGTDIAQSLVQHFSGKADRKTNRFFVGLLTNSKGKKLLLAAGAFCGAAAVCLMLTRLYSDGAVNTLLPRNRLIVFAAVFVLTALCYFSVLLFGGKRTASVLIALMLFAESGIYTSRALVSGSEREREYSLDWVEKSAVIAEEWGAENDGLSRVKVEGSTLNSNYPLIMDYPSMANFTHVLPENLQGTMSNLGYSITHTRILDSCGTALCDAILNIKNTLSLTELNDELYSYVGEYGGYKLYENRFALPVGITFDSQELLSGDLDGKSSFENVEMLYSALSESDRKLIETPKCSVTGDNNQLTFTFSVGEKSELYLDCIGLFSSKHCMTVEINGEKLRIDSLGEENNMLYPTAFNNGVLDLGTFENETVRITLSAKGKEKLNRKKIRLGLMSLSALGELCDRYKGYSSSVEASGRSLSLTVESDGGYVFLPLTFDSGWACTVNGEKTEIQTALGSFTAVKLVKGENRIEMKFTPRGLRFGAAVSAEALILLALWLLFRNKFPNFSQSRAGNAIYSATKIGYFAALLAVYAGMYLLCIVMTVVNVICGN